MTSKVRTWGTVKRHLVCPYIIYIILYNAIANRYAKNILIESETSLYMPWPPLYATAELNL